MMKKKISENRIQKRIYGPALLEAGENCTVRSSIMHILHQLLLG
jgi:hypothetical protein